MFSNMLKQLKDAGKEDKLQEVLEEIPRVRRGCRLSAAGHPDQPDRWHAGCL